MKARIVASVLLTVLAAGATQAQEPRSGNYRLVGAGTASISAETSSPAYSLLVVGGAGQAAGIGASPTISVVSGGTSTQLPTSRIFRDGLEP